MAENIRRKLAKYELLLIILCQFAFQMADKEKTDKATQTTTSKNAGTQTGGTTQRFRDAQGKTTHVKTYDGRVHIKFQK